MDELTRFARVLVERLGVQSGTSTGPVSVRAIRMEILPYRAERRNLGLSSVEDYETVLLRLVAEEKGFVKTAPGTAAERCRAVLATPNPDLGVLEEIAESTIQFTSLAAGPSFVKTSSLETSSRLDVLTSSGADDRSSTDAPSRQAAETTGRRDAETTGRRDAETTSRRDAETPRGPADLPSSRPTGRPAVLPSDRPSCPHASLPAGRTVVFCPWCGERLIPLLCERCGAEFESEWRHCIACGSPVQDPYRRS